VCLAVSSRRVSLMWLYPEPIFNFHIVHRLYNKTHKVLTVLESSSNTKSPDLSFVCLFTHGVALFGVTVADTNPLTHGERCVPLSLSLSVLCGTRVCVCVCVRVLSRLRLTATYLGGECVMMDISQIM
jgi:hypothetical protein